MDTLSRFEEVAALGRKLVDELGGERRVDTLARWMAHYVAELIDGARDAPPAERGAARGECFEKILELWDHRAALPNGRRPFENLEPIMRALESLEPGNDARRYCGSVGSAMGASDEGPAMQSVVEFVNSVDHAARIIVVQALVEAALPVLDESRELVALAEEAGADTGPAGIVVAFISKNAGREEQSDEADSERRELAGRIESLELFTRLAAAVSDDLRRRLDALASVQDTPRETA